MASLANKTALITGASRGIGKAIALTLADAGCNLVLAGKTVEPHPRLAGTLLETEQEAQAKGAKTLVHQVDVRFEDEVELMVKEAVRAFGGIDLLINNAGAISLTDLASTSMKKFDLMFGVNVRATYLCAKACLPHLEKSDHAHILSMSPPPSLKPSWLSGHVAYTMSKYGMSMVTLGLSDELKDRGIAVNSLWPRTVIWTAAVNMLLGEDGKAQSRTPEIMADAARAILETPPADFTGRCVLDEEILTERGVTDFDKYLLVPGAEPMLDLYVED